MTSSDLNVISNSGKGKAFVVLHENASYFPTAEAMTQSLVLNAHVLHLACPVIDDSNWGQLADVLATTSNQNEMRSFSLVTFGAASVLAQVLALKHQRMIRTLFLIDPSVRPHPTAAMKYLDAVEAFLPLGLPFRTHTQGFDGKSLLQRLRCPTLIATTRAATPFINDQAKEIAAAMPTAWQVPVHAITAERELEELCAYALEFAEIPARYPQKNVRAQGGGR